MSLQSDKFRTKKNDQSPYLFHFTKGTLKEAKEALHSILRARKLIAHSNDYNCFTASPITSLLDFFITKVARTGEPMYQPLGIGFSRDIMIRDYGARNVIYGDVNESPAFAKELSWRFLPLNVDVFDWEYLREWRTNGKEFDFSNFPIDHMIVIAPDDDCLADLIVDIDYEYDPICDFQTGEVYCNMIQRVKREFKGVTIQDVENLKNDYQVSHLTRNQVIGEDAEELMHRVFKCYELKQKFI